jgi:hypothetical protein
MRRILILALFLFSLTHPVYAEGLSESQLKNAVRPYMQAVRECVDRQRELDPSVGGRMDLSFTIGNRGRVTKVQVLTGDHERTYAAGCVDGVLRSVKFPKFPGRPVVVPHFPVGLKNAEAADISIEEEDDQTPPKVREAPRKLRAPVLRLLKTAEGTIRACAKDHEEKPKRKRKKKIKSTALTITFTLNPLGRVTAVKVLDQAHQKDHLAGCVTGVLVFAEFPSVGSEPLTISRAKLSRL